MLYLGSIIIQQSDGMSYDLDECGFRVISFDPPQTAFNHSFTTIYNNKPTLTQTVVNQATIPLTLMIKACDYEDYELQVIKLKKVFSSFKPFYVINSRVPYIRYKVLAQAFDIKRLNNFYYSQTITINLLTVDGCGESVGLTSNQSFVNDLNSWGFGENIPSTELSYHFTQNSFTFWNLGNIPLMADSHPVLMKIKANANNLEIINHTTGQTWQLNKQISKDKELDITGMKPIYDGNNVFSNTNHSYLDFEVGSNQIEIKNASDLDITFETRFYY